MSYANILGTMYELCSYYDNGFITDKLCYIISSMVFIMTPTKRKTSKVQFLWLIDKPGLNCTPKNHKHGFDLNYQRPWVTIIQRALQNGKFRTLSKIAYKMWWNFNASALLLYFCSSFCRNSDSLIRVCSTLNYLRESGERKDYSRCGDPSSPTHFDFQFHFLFQGWAKPVVTFTFYFQLF